MTTGKTIALTRWTFVDKVMSLLFNMLSRLVIAFARGMLLEDIGDLMHHSLPLSEVPHEKVLFK